MAKSNKKDRLNYEERETLNERFSEAVSGILAAEEQAKAIIEQAGATVNEMRLDGAAREKSMRETAAKQAAEYRLRATERAEKEGEEQAERIKKQAREHGEQIIKDKQKQIEQVANELFKTLGG